jgi:NAD(P)-dependent dehydrogenase (short-subunit alcohol dehydrogenase family)
MEFSDRAAVVTGAASGIGKATAIGFAAGGANVALFDVDQDGMNEVAEQIEGLGREALISVVDMAVPAAVRSALQSTFAHFGRLDAVANVAAITQPTPLVPEVTEELWDRMMSINLKGVFFCCQEALRIMIPQGHGAIVNVASSAGFRPRLGHSVYGAAKAGVVGLSRVLALECARTGVRVNVVSPGHTAGDRQHRTLSQAQLDAIAAPLPYGRWLTPDELANAILWLCSDAASGANGAIINVTGGDYMP